MASTEKKKPTAKKRPQRKKKSRLKQYLPLLAVAALLAAFTGWRMIAVLRQHEVPSAVEPASAVRQGSKPPGTEAVRKSPQKEKAPKEAPRGTDPQASRPPEKHELSPSKTPEAAAAKKEKAPARPAESLPPDKPPAPAVSTNVAGMVSIVIDDAGNNLELLKEALRVLPRSVTFAVIPFLPYSGESAELIHKEGFHVILHSPMQAEDPTKCRSCLSTGMTRKEVEGTLELQLGSVPHAEGLNNHTGSRATKDPALMSHVMNELKKRGLYFLDSRTTPFTEALKTAKKTGIRAAERKVFLDDESSESGILLKMDELALAGIKDKKAVGIGHLRPGTVKVLSNRILYWQKRGVVFIPLAEAVE